MMAVVGSRSWARAGSVGRKGGLLAAGTGSVLVLQLVLWAAAPVSAVAMVQDVLATSTTPTSVQVQWSIATSTTERPSLATNLTHNTTLINDTTTATLADMTIITDVIVSVLSLDQAMPTVNMTVILSLNTNEHTFNNLEEYSLYEVRVRVVAMVIDYVTMETTEDIYQAFTTVRTLPDVPGPVESVRVRLAAGGGAPPTIDVDWTFNNTVDQNGPIVRYGVRLIEVSTGVRQIHRLLLVAPQAPDLSSYSVRLPSRQVAMVTPNTEYEVVVVAHSSVGPGEMRRFFITTGADTNTSESAAAETTTTTTTAAATTISTGAFDLELENRWKFVSTGLGSLLLGGILGGIATGLAVCLVCRARRNSVDISRPSRQLDIVEQEDLYTEIQKHNLKPISHYAGITETSRPITPPRTTIYDVLECGGGESSVGSCVYDYVNDSLYTFSCKQTAFVAAATGHGGSGTGGDGTTPHEEESPTTIVTTTTTTSSSSSSARVSSRCDGDGDDGNGDDLCDGGDGHHDKVVADEETLTTPAGEMQHQSHNNGSNVTGAQTVHCEECRQGVQRSESESGGGHGTCCYGDQDHAPSHPCSSDGTEIDDYCKMRSVTVLSSDSTELPSNHH